MRGEIMAIGGLSDKIVGSLKANVNKFIYPKENMRQFEDFMEKIKITHSLMVLPFIHVAL